MALTDNLVAHWRLEESGSANRVDEVAGATLVPTGTLSAGTGRQGSGVVLTNTDYLVGADINDWTQSWTVSTWVKFSGSTGEQTIVSQGDVLGSFRVFYYNVGGSDTLYVRLFFNNEINIPSAFASAKLVLGHFHHLVVTFNAATPAMNVWLDAVQYGPHTNTGNAAYDNNDTIQVGKNATATIDELSMWSRVITSTEVATLYNSGSGLAYPFSTTALYQSAYRWRNDNGSESGATWLGAENTDVSLNAITTARLRVQSDATGDEPAIRRQLQYRKVGDTEWKGVR